ncbi:MAG TPA: hypothetical protein HA224_01125 [Nanoarchaeota archaeon]|nr:hypothetical protein [Nanoarchaeota archaeon]
MDEIFLPKARFPIERFNERSECPKGSVKSILSNAGIKLKEKKEEKKD